MVEGQIPILVKQTNKQPPHTYKWLLQFNHHPDYPIFSCRHFLELLSELVTTLIVTMCNE